MFRGLNITQLCKGTRTTVQPGFVWSLLGFYLLELLESMNWQITWNNALLCQISHPLLLFSVWCNYKLISSGLWPDLSISRHHLGDLTKHWISSLKQIRRSFLIMKPICGCRVMNATICSSMKVKLRTSSSRDSQVVVLTSDCFWLDLIHHSCVFVCLINALCLSRGAFHKAGLA